MIPRTMPNLGALAVASALLAACGSSSSTPKCNDTCPSAGASQCSGLQVQTCTADMSGCLAWSVATACSTGQGCDAAQGKCVDPCLAANLQAACTGALVNLNQNCGGTLTFAATGLAFCQALAKKNSDPTYLLSSCTAYQTANFQTLHAGLKGAGLCCCGTGQYCDYEDTTGWACIPTCTTNANCSGVTGRNACAPNDDPAKDAPVKTPYICKADDGLNWHGCNGLLVFCGGANHSCTTDANGNKFCATSCTTDAQCGNPTQACCNLASNTACGVCL